MSNEFKLIVAGGRDFNDYPLLVKEISNLQQTETLISRNVSIVSGMAKGADALGVRFAKNYDWKLYSYPADWDEYGKSAGFVRNKQMGQFADGLIAFWDGKSRGTAHMIQYIRSLRKPLHIIRY